MDRSGGFVEGPMGFHGEEQTTGLRDCWDASRDRTRLLTGGMSLLDWGHPLARGIAAIDVPGDSEDASRVRLFADMTLVAKFGWYLGSLTMFPRHVSSTISCSGWGSRVGLSVGATAMGHDSVWRRFVPVLDVWSGGGDLEARGRVVGVWSRHGQLWGQRRVGRG